MIKLSENRAALRNLGAVIKSLEDVDKCIAYYSPPAQPPVAYVAFTVGNDSIEVQMKPADVLVSLNLRRQELIDYLATLGISV